MNWFTLLEHNSAEAVASTMPSPAFIVIFAVLLPISAIARFLVLDRWIERLNEGLPPNEQFSLIGWWTFREQRRAWRRWRQIKRST